MFKHFIENQVNRPLMTAFNTEHSTRFKLPTLLASYLVDNNKIHWAIIIKVLFKQSLEIKLC
jgi:hypothetical protein